MAISLVITIHLLSRTFRRTRHVLLFLLSRAKQCNFIVKNVPTTPFSCVLCSWLTRRPATILIVILGHWLQSCTLAVRRNVCWGRGGRRRCTFARRSSMAPVCHSLWRRYIMWIGGKRYDRNKTFDAFIYCGGAGSYLHRYAGKKTKEDI